MKQLSKVHKARRDEIVAALTEKATVVEDAWARLTEAHDDLTEAIEAYNEALADAVGWRDDMAQEMQDYFDERSERWQEGEDGTAYGEWINEWQVADLEELVTPELPDEPEFPHADTLEGLPEEPAQ